MCVRPPFLYAFVSYIGARVINFDLRRPFLDTLYFPTIHDAVNRAASGKGLKIVVWIASIVFANLRWFIYFPSRRSFWFTIL